MAKICFEGDEMRYSNKLPSVSPELYMAYDNSVRCSVNFSTVPLYGSVYNYTQISDVFELSDYVADKLAVIGHEHNFGEIGIDRFRVDLLNQIHDDTHIGLLLSCVSKKRKEECFSYGMWADFISIGKAVYCAITVCFVDKDSAYNMVPRTVKKVLRMLQRCYSNKILNFLRDFHIFRTVRAHCTVG